MPDLQYQIRCSMWAKDPPLPPFNGAGRFNVEDVIDKFGLQTECYLTGRPVRLDDPGSYHFDHITPTSRGGDSSIDNLGIACKSANLAKHQMTVPELIQLCIEILIHNGYLVTERQSDRRRNLS